MPTPRKDYYAILGISPNAADADIRSAFRRAARKFHPDLYAAKGQAALNAATTRFREVTEAYEVLSDEKKRARYDRTDPEKRKKALAEAVEIAFNAVNGNDALAVKLEDLIQTYQLTDEELDAALEKKTAAEKAKAQQVTLKAKNGGASLGIGGIGDALRHAARYFFGTPSRSHSNPGGNPGGNGHSTNGSSQSSTTQGSSSPPPPETAKGLSPPKASAQLINQLVDAPSSPSNIHLFDNLLCRAGVTLSWLTALIRKNDQVNYPNYANEYDACLNFVWRSISVKPALADAVDDATISKIAYRTDPNAQKLFDLMRHEDPARVAAVTGPNLVNKLAQSPRNKRHSDLFTLLLQHGGITSSWLMTLIDSNERMNYPNHMNDYEACVRLIDRAIAQNPHLASLRPMARPGSSPPHSNPYS